MIRTLTLSLLFVFFACISGNKRKGSVQNRQSNADTVKLVIDTSEVYILRGGYLGNSRYSILLGHLVQDRSHVVQLSQKNQIIATLLFPISNDEVKNFGINKIQEISNGFLIKSNWGGGNYFYNREFLFRYIKDSFYLHQVNYKLYQHDIDNVIEKDSLLPNPINIQNFDPRQFISDE